MYHVIVNPNSRTGQGALVGDYVARQLKSRGFSYKIHQTQCVGHAREIASTLTSTGKPIQLIAIGGDGTINEVLDGIQNYSLVDFGYIPTGSGNDFASGMGIPQETSAALENILNSTNSMSMDVGRLLAGQQVHHFGVSAGFGFDAAICHEALSSPIKKVLNKLKLGKLTYLMIAIKQLILWRPCQMEIQLDHNRTYTYKKTYFVAAMNQRCEGGGLRLCPKARPNDQKLDVFIAEGLPKWKILLLLPTAFFGKHTKFKGVHIMQSTSIHIVSERNLPIHRDGESNGFSKNLTILLESKPLKVKVPVL